MTPPSQKERRDPKVLYTSREEGEGDGVCVPEPKRERIQTMLPLLSKTRNSQARNKIHMKGVDLI